MTIYSAYSPTSLYANDYPRQTHPIVLASGSNASGTVAPRGLVLGRVTATDKYIPCVKTASDGSQTPAAILATGHADASAGDVNCMAYFTGGFEGRQLTIDSSWTIAQLEAAFRLANPSVFINDGGTVA